MWTLHADHFSHAEILHVEYFWFIMWFNMWIVVPILHVGNFGSRVGYRMWVAACRLPYVVTACGLPYVSYLMWDYLILHVGTKGPTCRTKKPTRRYVKGPEWTTRSHRNPYMKTTKSYM